MREYLWEESLGQGSSCASIKASRYRIPHYTTDSEFVYVNKDCTVIIFIWPGFGFRFLLSLSSEILINVFLREKILVTFGFS